RQWPATARLAAPSAAAAAARAGGGTTVSVAGVVVGADQTPATYANVLCFDVAVGGARCAQPTGVGAPLVVPAAAAAAAAEAEAGAAGGPVGADGTPATSSSPLVIRVYPSRAAAVAGVPLGWAALPDDGGGGGPPPAAGSTVGGGSKEGGSQRLLLPVHLRPPARDQRGDGERANRQRGGGVGDPSSGATQASQQHPALTDADVPAREWGAALPYADNITAVVDELVAAPVAAGAPVPQTTRVCKAGQSSPPRSRRAAREREVRHELRHLQLEVNVQYIAAGASVEEAAQEDDQGGGSSTHGGGEESQDEERGSSDGAHSPASDHQDAVDEVCQSEAWKALALRVLEAADEAGGRLNMRRLVRSAYIDSPATDTEVWFWVDADRRAVVAAFRGTQTHSWKNFLTDALAGLVPFTPGGHIDLQSEEEQMGLPEASAVASATGAAPAGVGDLVAAAAMPVVQAAEAVRSVLLRGGGDKEPPNSDDGGGRDAESASAVSECDADTSQSGEEADAAHSIADQGDTADTCQHGAGHSDGSNGSDGSDAGDGEQPLVHFGFLRAYASIREPLLAQLCRLTGGFASSWTVYCTGHSLGGALATLAAADLRARHPAPAVALVSFGQPKVGNATWARTAARLCPTAFRVVNGVDGVPRTPTGDYRHVGRVVVVDAEGGLTVGEEAFDEDAEGDDGDGGDGQSGTAGDGGGGGDGCDDAAQGQVNSGGMVGDLARRWRTASSRSGTVVTWWASQVSADVLAHHLEEAYLASLTQCVERQASQQQASQQQRPDASPEKEEGGDEGAP
ncbi:hypothetical protein BU14_1542s0001, partial [Porphyra umbilicalis]